MAENTRTVSNERIIAALIQSGTVEKAAAAAGCSPRTVYSRMREQEFKGMYADAKADVLRAAVFAMNDRLSAAVEAITEIMQDAETNPAVRLQAAQTLLNNAGKYTEVLAAAEKAAEKANQEEKVTLADLLYQDISGG